MIDQLICQNNTHCRKVSYPSERNLRNEEKKTYAIKYHAQISSKQTSQKRPSRQRRIAHDLP